MKSYSRASENLEVEAPNRSPDIFSLQYSRSPNQSSGRKILASIA